MQEKFKIREKETIQRTREECRMEAAAEAARVAEVHRKEMEAEQQRYI